MFPVRALVRLFVVLLVTAIAGGSALLDGWLLSCQSGAPAMSARTGHCHTTSASTNGTHLRDVARCCHDGSSGFADTNDTQSKLIAGSFIALTELTVDGRCCLSRGRVVLAGRSHVFSVFDSRHTPLRL
jgi:hypothetical protein